MFAVQISHKRHTVASSKEVASKGETGFLVLTLKKYMCVYNVIQGENYSFEGCELFL